MSKPSWNPTTRTWTFHASRILRQLNNQPGTIQIPPPRIANPTSFTDATLFIDSGFACSDPNATADAGPGVNWSGCTITGSYLANASLWNANFSGITLTGSNLQNTVLTNADLVNANLLGTWLENVNFAGANLSGANFTWSGLDFANLQGATVTGANFSNVGWNDTTCPDGTNSNNDGYTCINNLG